MRSRSFFLEKWQGNDGSHAVNHVLHSDSTALAARVDDLQRLDVLDYRWVLWVLRLGTCNDQEVSKNFAVGIDQVSSVLLPRKLVEESKALHVAIRTDLLRVHLGQLKEVRVLLLGVLADRQVQFFQLDYHLVFEVLILRNAKSEELFDQDVEFLRVQKAQ